VDGLSPKGIMKAMDALLIDKGIEIEYTVISQYVTSKKDEIANIRNKRPRIEVILIVSVIIVFYI
jgi:hypothetical protein